MKYLLFISLCVIASFALANDDFEIIDEGDDQSSGQPNRAKKKKSDFEKAYEGYLGENEEFKWSDQMLSDN